MKRYILFADAITAAGIDIKKDFFELRSDEINAVDKIRRAFKYSGKNSLGRSAARQFYYSAQRANKKSC